MKEDINKLAEEFASQNDLSIEINLAYIENVGAEYAKAEDVAESYSGDYESDEEFALDLAEQTGFIQPSDWPYNCIDWEQASRDIMFDYFESNGHYFRNL